MAYIAFCVSEEDKSNNKKSPAPSSSKEAIYFTAYTHQHRAKQVLITNKNKVIFVRLLFFRRFFNKFHQSHYTNQDVTTTIVFNQANKRLTRKRKLLIKFNQSIVCLVIKN